MTWWKSEYRVQGDTKNNWFYLRPEFEAARIAWEHNDKPKKFEQPCTLESGKEAVVVISKHNDIVTIGLKGSCKRMLCHHHALVEHDGC